MSSRKKRIAPHEHAAFAAKRIAYLGLGLLSGVGVIAAILLAVLHAPYSAQRNAAFIGDDGIAQPRLQSAPLGDLQKFRDDKQRALSEYAWVDRRNGIVRIPIDRAMDILAARTTTEHTP